MEEKFYYTGIGSMAGRDMTASALLGAKDKPQSPFDSLDSAVSNLQQVLKRISTLADILVGGQPMGGDGNSPHPPSNGHFDTVEINAAIIRSVCDEIMSNLGRIERRL